MDGGGFSVIDENIVHTVFNREGVIYACTVGESEQRIGTGRSCTMDATNNGNAYAWVENGNVVYVDSNGRKTSLGRGQLPTLNIIDSDHAICVWENEKRIMKAVVAL
jgi:hypothetical protein